MDLSGDSSDLTILIVCLVSHDASLQKEVAFISEEVLPRLWLWCNSQKVKLVVNHCKLKEELVEEVVNGLKCHYVDSAKPRSYMSLIVNLISEFQVETIDAFGDTGMEFGCKEASTHSLFLLFRNICSSCFPGECINYESVFKCNVQSNEILHITRQCQYCEETSDVGQPTANFSFCKKFLDFFQSYISLKLNSKSPAAVGSDGWVDHLSSLQLSRINSTDAYLNPVKETVDKISSIIKDDLTQVPLLLLGEPGTLKTSIIAAAILRTAEQELNSEPRQLSVFYHFAGLLPRSMELDVFLRRLVRQLNLVEDLGTSIDICLAVQLCNVALSNPSAAPIIIYVDSVDLLDDIVSGQKVKWIPSKLAPKVRLVLSTTTGSAQHLALKQRTNSPIEIFISALQIPSRMLLVSSSLSDVYPRTWAEVVSKITGMDASSNPAWIGAVCCLLSLSAKTASVCCTDFDQLQGKIESTVSQTIQKIWEDILSCLEQLLSRDQVVCILSLIAVAAAGLRRSELLSLLNSHPLVLPSPFEEKAEAEALEKVISCSYSVTPQLTVDQLDKILLELKPCTLLLFDGNEDRFYIRSDVLRNAIRNKYFVYSDVTCLPNEDSDMLDLSCFWHQKLANYFQSLPDSDRKFEEYLFQVCHLEDSDGLAEYLTQWSVFDRLYTDEHSTILLSYWKKAGGTGEMISRYKSSLAKLEADRVDADSLAVRHEQVARLFILTGRYAEALELAKRALKWEEKELGMRPERMVEVYGLLTDIYDEKLKLQDFISPSQIPDLRRTISYGRKSIDIRRQLTGRYHKFKLGVSLMKLAFSLESWAGCGGDDTFATTAALTEGQGHADKAIEIFKELNDQGHYAEALMTKGVLSLRGTPEQLRLYHEALDICQEVNGEYHILTSRIYINIGIVYEDNKDYVKAYKYFAKWARVNEVVLGPSHPKTMRAQRVLREPRYMYIASRLKDLERPPVDESDRGNVLNEDIINAKARQLDESTQERGDEGSSDGDEERDAEEPDVLDAMRPAHSTLFSLASELRRNIEEMLQHAMRESRDDDEDLRALFADNRVTDRVTELESVLSSDSCTFDSDGDNNNEDNDNENDDDSNGDNEVS